MVDADDYQGTKIIEVKASTADNLLEETDIDTVDAIKMDLEGYEVEVLKGCRQIFSRSGSPLKLFMEVHQEYLSEGELKACFNDLFEQGFEPAALIEHEYGPIERGLFMDAFVRRVCEAEAKTHVMLVK